MQCKSVLPHGWEAKVDPTRGTYYIDHINKKTQWEHPGKALPPPAYNGRPMPSEEQMAIADNEGRNILTQHYVRQMHEHLLKAHNKKLDTYRDQKVRLETFSDWPSSAPVKQHVLAQEGFYYLNEGDKVKCAFCNLLLHSWKAKQSPRDLHKQRNPNCPFLNKKEGHVPKFVRSTRHPMYGRYERRLATFVSWPLNAYVSAEALADAGLFYRDFMDAVTCFNCDCTLMGWEKGDEPWLDHGRAGTFCEFIRNQPDSNPHRKHQPGRRVCVDIGYETEDRQKLGDFIRQVNFSKVRRQEYDGDTTNPHPEDQMENLESLAELNGDVKFEELKVSVNLFGLGFGWNVKGNAVKMLLKKYSPATLSPTGCVAPNEGCITDAFEAFEKQVCVSNYPGRDTPAYDMANGAMSILDRMMSSFSEGRGGFYAPAEKVRLHTMIALLKSGPGATHTAMIDHHFNSDEGISKLVKSFGRNEIMEMLTVIKELPYKLTPNENKGYDDEANAWHVYKAVTQFLILFKEEQKKIYQTEFLGVANHLTQKMPKVTKPFAEAIKAIVNIMVQDFEDGNQFEGVENPDELKKHISTVKDLVMRRSYKKDCTIDRTAEEILEKMFRSIFPPLGDSETESESDSESGQRPKKDKRIEIPLLSAVFDDMMHLLVDMNNNRNAQTEGGNIFTVYERWLFETMGLMLRPSPDIVKSCAFMITSLVSKPKMNKEAEKMIKEAIVHVIYHTPENGTAYVIEMLNAIILSERESFVDQGIDVIKKLKKFKSRILDWKKHTDGAKKLLDNADAKHRKKSQGRKKKKKRHKYSDDEDSDRNEEEPHTVYLDFRHALREQLRDDRVVLFNTKEGEKSKIDVEKTRLIDEMYKNIGCQEDKANSCAAMLPKIILHGEMSKDAEKIVIGAVKEFIIGANFLSSLATQEIMKVLNAVLLSGRIHFLDLGKDILSKFEKQDSALDWKEYMHDAKQLLETAGDLPDTKLQVDSHQGVESTMDSFCSFVKKLVSQLKKSKATPKLQKPFLICCEKCVSSKTKAKIADAITENGCLNFAKDKSLTLLALEKCEHILKSEAIPYNKFKCCAVANIMDAVLDTYDGDGRNVSKEENELFVDIFKLCSTGKLDYEHFYITDYYDRSMYTTTIYGEIFLHTLSSFLSMHQKWSTLECVAPIMPDVVRWADLALEDDHENLWDTLHGYLLLVGYSSPAILKISLPQIMDLFLKHDKCQSLMVPQLYQHNPKAVHDRLQDMFDNLNATKTTKRQEFIKIFKEVSGKHPEVFTKDHIEQLFWLYRVSNITDRPMILYILHYISQKNASNLKDYLPKICDDHLFNSESMIQRAAIIANIGALNKGLGQAAIDYLMKYAKDTDPNISQCAITSLSTLVRDHIKYMQKDKQTLEKIETKPQNANIKKYVHDIILILEGKSVEVIAKDVEKQQKEMVVLDTKVDATIGTVVAIGDKVIEHDEDIGELGEGLERVEERVDDVEEDLGETKVKVEEIDNKTMSNAPKWSRDLTKLMNPKAENDWRLLASRLGYSNDDIRGWATQHDPCMALLSEWYATHKTSEASYGVLTALQEMNRTDGVVIVENAMKAAEGVVEDEDFEYPSPPQVFISYQWGVQNEVKLLRQHLNMAGYECWLDIGQMGGGDKLFAKIDNGIRGAKVVICCVTEKYAQSPNCNREVNLSVNLNKPIIPLLMERTDWPPKGSMGPIFSEYLFIRFFQRGDGEQTKDKRYWPVPKFQELLMQLNFYVVPDQKMIKKEYANWWAPMVEDIVIDKNKGKKDTAQKPKQNSSQVVSGDASPLVFLSYQWGKQPEVKMLYKRLTTMGYTVWMDIYQMGGGDSLYDKIDRGMRGCKVVVSCVTQKYSLSANCRREVSLADALKKPILPLLLEQIKWPPDGPMSMVFTELLYINCCLDKVQALWSGEKYDELMIKLKQFIPDATQQGTSQSTTKALTAAQHKGVTSKIGITARSSDTKLQSKLNNSTGSNLEKKNTSKIQENDDRKGSVSGKNAGDRNSSRKSIKGNTTSEQPDSKEPTEMITPLSHSTAQSYTANKPGTKKQTTQESTHSTEPKAKTYRDQDGRKRPDQAKQTNTNHKNGKSQSCILL